jgi:hypothetical protein
MDLVSSVGLFSTGAGLAADDYAAGFFTMRDIAITLLISYTRDGRESRGFVGSVLLSMAVMTWLAECQSICIILRIFRENCNLA